MSWTAGLAPWYIAHGRHHLPWRQTRDPWAVLVSEVMLQQTQVGRVVPYWERFLARWPAPQDCARAALADVLQEWQGLGYPRRAVALHDTATLVSREGWPLDEAGLRRLPGVGRYTARVLLTLALDAPSPPPLDVNIARVAARAAAGREPGEIAAGELERRITAARPRALDGRGYTFALFDAGALHCRARPRCDGCPLSRGCASRARLSTSPQAGDRREAGAEATSSRAAARGRAVPYARSMRRLRGILLAASLEHGGQLTSADVHAALIGRAPELRDALEPGAVEHALSSLAADRLIEQPTGRTCRPAAAPSG